MTVCVIAAFYICIFPTALRNGLKESQIAISCSVSKVLRFITHAMLYLSSSMNPIICMTFVQSFRQGFKEIIMRWRKCFTTRSNMETSQSEEITLRDMRIIPGIGKNLSFSENWPWKGRLNFCVKIIAIFSTEFQKTFERPSVTFEKAKYTVLSIVHTKLVVF